MGLGHFGHVVAQSEEVAAAACIQFEVPGSEFPLTSPSIHQGLVIVGDLMPDSCGKDRLLSFPSTDRRKSLHMSNTYTDCLHDIPQK